MPAIRDATEAGPPRTLEITNHAIAHTTADWSSAMTTMEARLAWVNQRRRLGFPVMVAAEDGAVIGFTSYGEFRPREGPVEHSVYVREDAQGRAVGRILLTALIAHAEKRGAHVMIGAIEARYAASVALHKWAVFAETGLQREVGWKFNRRPDPVFMQKILAGS
jgi:L-amino acid N-acyltransferase YncA